MKKKNKKPKELMIKSVIEDLEKEMQGEASIHPNESENRLTASHIQPTALSNAVLNPEGPTSDESDGYELPAESTGTVEVPAGLNLSEQQKKAYARHKSAPPPVEEDKTQLVNNPQATAVGTSAKPSTSAETVIEKGPVSSPPPVAAKTEQKISFGGQSRSSGFEAQFMQAENLKLAQQRIIELEKDLERLRKENEILASAGELAQQKIEDFMARITGLERQKNELKETSTSELNIFRDGLAVKESEILRLRTKVSELESRLSNDLRKIRVRERELENRLELSKMEKTALLKSKDETILELKRKNDTLLTEVENYQNRVIELNHKIEANQEQFGRTVRALRIALTNLEVNENTSSITIAPLKKAE